MVVYAAVVYKDKDKDKDTTPKKHIPAGKVSQDVGKQEHREHSHAKPHKQPISQPLPQQP